MSSSSLANSGSGIVSNEVLASTAGGGGGSASTIDPGSSITGSGASGGSATLRDGSAAGVNASERKTRYRGVP